MVFFKKNQFLRVFAMQDALNIKAAGADWKDQNLPWSIAIVREVGEAFDHLGWEWWKKTTPNIEQLKLELIDIIHFTVSACLLADGTPEEYFDEAVQVLSEIPPDQLAILSQFDVPGYLLEITGNAVGGNYGFVLYLALRALDALGMSTDEVFNAYVAKNVLNGFRKANGYKEGAYVKIWLDGREDNEHLTAIIKATDADRPDFIEHLQSELEAAYKPVKAAVTH